MGSAALIKDINKFAVYFAADDQVNIERGPKNFKTPSANSVHEIRVMFYKKLLSKGLVSSCVIHDLTRGKNFSWISGASLYTLRETDFQFRFRGALMVTQLRRWMTTTQKNALQ